MAIGIVRWYFLLLRLELCYAHTGTSETTRETIEVVYNAFNAYAGDIGELKEVGLFAGTWTALVQVVLTRLGARVLTNASFVSARGCFLFILLRGR